MYLKTNRHFREFEKKLKIFVVEQKNKKQLSKTKIVIKRWKKIEYYNIFVLSKKNQNCKLFYNRKNDYQKKKKLSLKIEKKIEFYVV